MASELYNGDVKMDFDPGKHHYFRDLGDGNGPQRCPSATQVGDMLPKDFTFWAVNVTLDYVDERLHRAIKARESIDELFIADLLDQAKRARWRKKKQAADAGTIAHRWVEDWITADINGTPYPGDPVSEDVAAVCAQFVDWAKHERVKFAFSERMVYSKEYDASGTVDKGFRRGTSPTLHIGDLKTGKSVTGKGGVIYNNIRLQLSFYQRALQEEGEDATGDRLVLHIPVTGGELATHYVTDDPDEAMRVFGALRTVWGWENGEDV